LKKDVAGECGGEGVDVIAVATHDTGSAVAAVPTPEKNFAYLSSGTWSLLGTEVQEPVITPRALTLNFTNEGGVEGRFRLLKNIMGLWLLQESRSEWERRGRKYGWDEIAEMGARAEPFRSFVNPDDARFLPPGDMPARIMSYCRDTGQPVPETDDAVIRCVMESLSLKYRHTLDLLQELTKTSLNKIHVVGGGVQNKVLCQWTANASGREVIAGPVEATAFGNMGLQLLAAGMVTDLADLRRMIRKSVEPERYLPQDKEKWEKAYIRYKSLIGKA